MRLLSTFRIWRANRKRQRAAMLRWQERLEFISIRRNRRVVEAILNEHLPEADVILSALNQLDNRNRNGNE